MLAALALFAPCCLAAEELITCEAFSHHGYNGIERETAAAIKEWIRQGG